MEQHVTRLHKSLVDMLSDSYLTTHGIRLQNIDALRESFQSSITPEYLAAFMSSAAAVLLQEIREGDIRVDVHVSAHRSGFPIFALGTSVPPSDADKEKCAVLIKEGKRGTPTIKDVQWIKDRGPLESLLTNEIGEVVLVDEHGYIYEGISSNFFVIRENGTGSLVLQTAGDEYVLKGTVRTSALQAASTLGMKIDMSRPRTTEISTWKEAFITSTTRGVKPIARVYLDGQKYDFQVDQGLRLRKAVENMEFENSAPIAQ